MKSYFLLILSICTSFLNAQPGFNRSYDFENLGAGFSSVVSSNDTIMAYGLIMDDIVNLTGLLFAQIDSFGNVISSSTYFDKDGDNFTRPYQNSLIKLSDNSGYIAVGQLFNKTNGYFIKYNNKCEVVHYKEYVDTVFTLNHFKEITELNSNSFLIVGNEAYQKDDITNGFLLNVDSTGNLIWERKYFEPTKITFLGNILKKSKNEILLSGQRTDRGSVSTSQRRYSSLIIQIDTLGNVLDTWQTDYSLNELGIGAIEIFKDGDIIYSTLRGQYNEEFNQIYTHPVLMRRDKVFSIISSENFGDFSPYPHNISHIQLLNNNDILTAGTIPHKYPIAPVTDEINSLSGWISKFDESGDIIWTFIDTAFWSNVSGSNNVIYDALKLTSGSIVACGYSRTLEPSPKDWGWLLKINSNGCIDTLNCEFVFTKSPESFALEVFPNPASSYVVFNNKNTLHPLLAFAIYNSNGALIENLNMKNISNPYHWNCESLPRGAYFYRILSLPGVVVTGKILIQ